MLHSALEHQNHLYMIKQDHDYMAYLTAKYLSSSNNNLIGKRLGNGTKPVEHKPIKTDIVLSGINKDEYTIRGN